MITPADFEGVDTTMAPSGKAPQGCVGGFDAKTGALDLLLGGEVSVLLLATVNGEIQANGVTCTATDMTPATTDNTLSVHVMGTAADETMILDLATGPFGAKLLTASGGIHVDLGAGQNTFFLRGSVGSDAVTAGTSAGKIVLDPEKAGAATVDIAGAQAITVSLGPGADTFNASGVAGSAPLALDVIAFGGAGNDVLEGGAGDDKLHGGDGDDAFKTGATADGADLYDGGAGSDTMDYATRTAALAVSIGTIDDDGAVGEHDDVAAGMEIVIGGSGDDTLVGGVGDESLYGNAGDDVLLGGPGSDLLDGGAGFDVLDAGEGDGDICISDPNESPKGCEL
jgi:Ca2+-binding RTX toxin-like protein